MTNLLTAIFTLLGIAIGSFLNVCIDRLPLHKSLVSPPSHCDDCQRQLTPLDMVPVLSYLWLRGRCRHCQARIPRRVLLVEVAGGLIFFLAFWWFVLNRPDSPEYAAFAITAFWSCVFLVIIFIDWEYKLILNKITYPAAILALAVLAIDSFLPQWGLISNIKSFWPESGILSISILNGVIAGAIGFVFFLIVFFISPRGIGMGDIKLAGLIGLVTGLPFVVIALMIGILIGGLVAIVILALRIKGRKDVLPYGTFLAIGPIITLLWGNEIFHWYRGLF